MTTIIKRLQSGVSIGVEELPHLKSASIGFWIKTGSRFEPPTLNGITHFVEHLLFKGTKKRNSSFKIAKEIESVGGHINAFTGREYTCIYSKVLPQYIMKAIDVLEDMFHNSIFDADEMNKEKIVILDEIKMQEDDPEDYVTELFMKGVLGQTGLGQSILGSHKTIKKMSRDVIFDYYKKNYVENKLVITIAGKVNGEKLIDSIEKLFDASKTNSNSKNNSTKINGENFKNVIDICIKNIGLTYFVLGTPGLGSKSNDRYKLAILDELFGGGCTSRLFQKIREEKGLVYDIHSSHSNFTDIGVFCVSGSCLNINVNEVLTLILNEMKKIKKGEIKKSEIEESKVKLLAGIEMSCENTDARMVKLGKNIISHNRDIPDEEAISKIKEISVDDIYEIAKKLWNNYCSLTILGNFKDKERKSLVRRIEEEIQSL